MLVLVTGAAGYIGSHTVLALLEAGHEVFAIDNLSNSICDGTGYPVSLTRVSELTGKPVSFEKADICDPECLETIFGKNKFEAVIHLAALKAVAESMVNPIQYYSNNVTGSIRLIELCRKHGVKNIIFSSSASVYGLPTTLPVNEDAPTGQNITNPYGQTKYLVEKLLIDIGKAEQDWNIVILRYFNPIGAHSSGRIGENPKGIPNNLMPFVSQVAIGKQPKLKIFGDKYATRDGTAVRDFIHISDLADGHLKALQRIERFGRIGTEIFNLGTGTGYSVLQMVDALKKVSGKRIGIEVCDPRPGDVAEMYCDPSLALEKLGWEAKLGIEEMTRDLWNWQSKNPNGFLRD